MISVQIDPLLSKGGISETVATPALSAELSMNNIQIHGISSIYLSEVSIHRRMISTEETAKVVAAVRQEEDLKNRMNSFFSSNQPGAIHPFL